MDVNTLCKASFNEGCNEELLSELSYGCSIGKMSFLQEKNNIQADALMAVKLDPAVLEAQVTIDNIENISEDRNSTDKAQGARKKEESKHRSEFEKAMCLQRAALFSLSSQQFSLLMKYVDTLRQQRLSLQKYLECGFCKNNGQPEAWYTTHSLKDGKGRVRCPVLRAFSCRRCGATGDNAHTKKYCPQR